MSREEKQQRLFKEFIDYQLKPFSLTYEDVKADPQWYMKYKTTPEAESQFKDYIVERCKEVLNLNAKAAENEASWFILQWGLSTVLNTSGEEYVENKKHKKQK